MAILEVCIDRASGLRACIDGNADRIELCSALPLGGLTPSHGLMQLAAETHLPAYAMIRPRDGDFCFSELETEIMCVDIKAAAQAGLTGVVLGAANPNGTLDTETLATLCSAAGSLKKTLHRVIDTLDNPVDALEQAIDLGFDHLLTSGGATSVGQGIALLAALHQAARGRIEIVAGAGLTPALVEPIANTGIRAFHSSCSKKQSIDTKLVSMGFASTEISKTDAALITAFKRVLDTILD